MKPDISLGWVVVNIGPPQTKTEFIVSSSFATKRTTAI